MKRKKWFILPLLFAGCFSPPEHQDKSIPLEKKVSLEKKGWIDDDTYQIFAAGSPDRSTFQETNDLRKSAVADAKKSARLQLHHQWLNSFLLNEENFQKLLPEQKKVAAELEDVISSARISMQNCDEANYCFLMLRLNRKNLRKWVGGLPSRLRPAIPVTASN